ncbi:alpha/beta fold hydrolase [Agromyces soli]
MSPAFPGAAGPALYAEAADEVLIAYRRFPATGAGDDAADASAGDDAADASAARPRPPVLLVHGFASNAAVTWQGTGWVGALTAVGREVVTVDLRGHGDSDAPVDDAAYRPDVLAADLVAVLDSAGIDRADVVAYSLGARIAAAFANAAPGRVRRLVIGGAGPEELFASWDLAAARAMLLRDEPAADPVMRQVLEPALRAGADREVLLACIEGVAGAPLAVPRGIPTLFVAGELDPVPAGARELAGELGAEYLEIPGRDHVSTLTARVFKDAAAAFLA